MRAIKLNGWSLLGFLFLLLGFIGALLPIMPTVPFILAAAACFARSSPKMHRWMRQHKKYGHAIRNWEEKRCISRKMKVFSITMIMGGGGTSTFLFVPPGWMSWAVFGVFAASALMVFFIRECPGEGAKTPDEETKCH